MTGPALSLMLLAAGYSPPQAQAILSYSWQESRFDPCASSWRGEGLFGVSRTLRGELRRYSLSKRTQAVAGSRKDCIPAEVQVAYLAEAFPRHYPACAKRFAQGDLTAFRRCWGEGRGR